MTICLMPFRFVFNPWVSCDLTSPVLFPNSVGAGTLLGKGKGTWLSSIAARRRLSLFNMALLLRRLGVGETVANGLFEALTGLVGELGSLAAGGKGGTFSLPTECDGLGRFVLSDAREPRFRGLSFSIGLAWTLTASGSSLKPIPGLDSDMLVTPLSRLARGG